MKIVIKGFYILPFILSLLIAQNSVDVLRLKNGDLIKGVIIENKINEYIKIELQGGSILSYKYDEIEAIDREVRDEIKVADNNKGNGNFFNISNDARTHAKLDYSRKGHFAPWILTAGSAFLLSPLLGGTAGVLLSYIVAGSDVSVPMHRLAELDNRNYSLNTIAVYTSNYTEEAKSVVKNNSLSASIGGCLAIWWINWVIITSA